VKALRKENPVLYWLLVVSASILSIYMLLLMWFFPVMHPTMLPAVKVDTSITGEDKTFDLFSPMPYRASMEFSVDGELFDENYVRENKDLLPTCTMELEIIPAFASNMDVITKKFDCFKRDTKGLYIGVTFPPGEVNLPVGFFKVRYAVRLNDVNPHKVKLTVSILEMTDIWRWLCFIPSLFKLCIYYVSAIIVGISRALTGWP